MVQVARILTIDDEPDIRRVFCLTLAHAGYEAFEAADGKSGIELVRKEQPDLVLCDLRMPRMDGLEVLSRLREEWPELPVIVVSGAGTVDDAVQALKRGAWDFITKPVMNVTLLTTAVERALERSRLLRENREYQRHLEETNSKLSRALDEIRGDQEAGKRTQFQLLPPDGQRHGEYRLSRRLFPSTFMSGDFVDYFALGEARTGFYLADVSGHGAASAFVTVMIKTLIDQYRVAHASGEDAVLLHPERTLARIDQDLLREKLDKHVTIFYGVLDHREHQLVHASGGHYPYPMLADAERVQVLDQPGRAVGLFPDSKFESHRIDLPEGARLLVVSDGLLELIEADTLEEKIAILREAFARPGVSMAELVERFGLEQRSELRDDVALLLLERGDHD